MKIIQLPQQERSESVDQTIERSRRGAVGEAHVVGDVATGEGFGVSLAGVLDGVLGERSLAGTVFNDPEVISGVLRHTEGCGLRALLLATAKEARTVDFQQAALMCDQVWVADETSARLVKNRIGPIGAVLQPQPVEAA